MKYLNEIVCADCGDILPKLPENCADSIVTDPPYNIGYKYNDYRDSLVWKDYFDWQVNVFELCSKLLKDGGSILWLNYPEVAAEVWTRVGREISTLRPVEWLTWIYHQHTGGKPLRRATRVWLWFAKGEPFINNELLTAEYRNIDDKRIRARVLEGFKPVDYDWWFYEQVKNVSAEKTGHPCQLPLAMVMRLVEAVTPPGGVVIDPFAGSGTTCVAAKKLQRRWIGIEKDKKYADEARQRLYDVSPDLLGD